MQTAITYLHSFAQVLVYLFIFAIFVRAVASWFVRDYSGRAMAFLVDVTEPILGPVRRLTPAALGVDFSPMVTILILYVVGQFLG